MTPEQLAALVALLRDGCNLRQRDGEHAAEAIEHLQSEVARLSTPPDNAEVRRLVDRVSARARARQNLSKRHMTISDADIDVAVSHHLTRLSHALAAETAKREAMEAALKPFADESLHVGPEHDFVAVSVATCDRARAALAKHGSK